ncbi:MAG: sodium-dependent transporter [Bacteroidetes bacterium]|nr:MAG: sodium-dependent transporter [Bacteroidota bacterium]
MSENQQRESFGSKFGVIAAAAGSAVGLGNIWKFPYETGSNGGAAFLLIYIAFIFILGIPTMLVEFSIGRRGQADAATSFDNIVGKKTSWSIVGMMGILSSLLIMSFYSTVAGWTLEYMFKAFSIAKEGVDTAQYFGDFIADPGRSLLWQVVFMALTAFVILQGVAKGIEKFSKILMPALFVIIVIICVRSVMLDGASEGLKFLFYPDFSKLTFDSALSALGQAFFSLSLGMGALITYGSYIQKKENLLETAVQVSVADTVVAVLAGVMIFPAVFAFGVEPGAGPSLVYITLPKIFAQMAMGGLWAMAFFLLLTIAALTSMISLLEVVVLFFVDRFKMKRLSATLLSVVVVMVLGVPVTLSMGLLGDFTIFGKNLFDLFDFIASNILMPLGGLLMVLFVGWGPGTEFFSKEITNEGTLQMKSIIMIEGLLKYVVPFLIAIILVAGLI